MFFDRLELYNQIYQKLCPKNNFSSITIVIILKIKWLIKKGNKYLISIINSEIKSSQN